MEINKQLFEDVLSDKLKGTFVLKNKQIVKSNTLKRSSNNNFPYKILIKYDNGVIDYGTYKSNGDFETFNTSYFDIIDFIPYTDMKENELIIEIPEGKIVDWDESKKQNKIILKDKQLTYEEICKKLFKDGHFYITNDNFTSACDRFATTEHQLECIIAKNKLATVAIYLNDGWDPTNTEDVIYYLSMDLVNRIFVNSCSIYGGHYFGNIVFKSEKLAQQAIEILGEETVKLALKPLGICQRKN